MSATMTTSKQTKRKPVPLNGVDTPTLFATINAVSAQPELGKFQFRAKNRWLSGTHSQSTMHGFFGAGGEHAHIAPYSAEGDHPAVLSGDDAAPSPVEWVLHALASCLTAGIGTIAAARGIKLNRVESTVEGDIDLRGVLGLSADVRNGYQGVKVSFEIDGDASPEQLEKIVMQSQARSAVYDILTNGVPVSVSVKTPATV
ncbi:MAG TPA: OsmC family protein [Roseiarcus sp.]|nr:OsmC family protein [Roseiarcus sp.]